MTNPRSISERLSAALSDRYRIERELGAGGMATVYLAADLKHDRKVAIKVLKPELAAVLGAERFVQEIKTTAALSHPHILPLFDSGEAGGFLYYVMPYIEGETIRDRLNRETQLGVDEAVKITTEVADALDYAHRHGVIHRDIKPENILLHDGRPMVMDFGIALALSAAAGGRMTETGLSLGTPHYMSPEQATAEKDITARSDVYSLASVLYEMLAGQPPHVGGSAQQIIMKIVTDAPRPVSELRKSVPLHVEAALLKALEKLPADRFGSAAEFGGALHDRTLTHARQAVAPGSAVRDPWLRRRASQALLAVLVVLAAWGGYAALKLTAPPAPHPLTSLPFEESPGKFKQLILGNDGRWLAEGNDSRTVKLHRLDDGTVRDIDLGARSGPAASSPDGRFLLVALATGELKRVPVDGGAPITVATGTDRPLRADWGDDGRIIYAGNDGLYVIPATGGEPTRIEVENSGNAWEPILIPGGRYVVYTQGSRDSPKGEIRILDLQTHESRKLLDDAMSPRYVAPGYLLYAARNRAVFAVPFDPRRASVTGAPRQVMDSVILAAGWPQAQYEVSDAGTALFRRGPLDEAANWMQRRFALVNQSGKEEILPVPPGRILRGRLTADGRRLAYDRDGRIFVYHLLTGLNRPVSPESLRAMWPIWSRDERQLFFPTYLNGGEATVAVPADDSGPARVVNPRAYGVSDLTPTSAGATDSSLLVSTWKPGSSAQIDLGTLVFGADTTYVPYLRADWKEFMGSLSPDGRWVAYFSNETGDWRLYVRSYPEPGKRHDVSPPELGVFSIIPPIWARDGHALYWSTGDSVMTAEVTLRPDFSSRPARALFRWKGTATGPWDVTADGRVLMTTDPPSDSADAARQAEGRRPGRTVIVVNWLDDLRARMKGDGGKP